MSHFYGYLVEEISKGRKEGRAIFFLYVDMKLYLLEYTLATAAMTANDHIYNYIHDTQPLRAL